MYSIKTASDDEKKTGNGILQQVKKYLITHEDYINTLLNQEVTFNIYIYIVDPLSLFWVFSVFELPPSPPSKTRCLSKIHHKMGWC